MKEQARKIYRGLGFIFLTIGIAFALVSIAERIFHFRFFTGNALPLALLVGLIGLALVWIARENQNS